MAARGPHKCAHPTPSLEAGGQAGGQGLSDMPILRQSSPEGAGRVGGGHIRYLVNCHI